MSHVAILICTHQGAVYLRQQLESIAAQTYDHWTVHVSDDGSTDDTRSILLEYQRRFGTGRLSIFDGPGQGFARNFMSLISRDSIRADYYALTDQDDEWHVTKLERAVAALNALPHQQPSIYGSRSELIDDQGRHLGFSRRFSRQPGFANALVQNMATGNTMVFNHASMILLRTTAMRVNVSAHDWWAYLLITGNGGAMVFDQYPTIRYRQHGRNLYGENRTLRAKLKRVRMLVNGDFQKWNGLNLGALRDNWSLLTERNRRRVESFERARLSFPLARLLYLWRSGVYRQTWDGQVALVVATLIRKI